MAQVFPIWITDVPELDIVYEGCHVLLRQFHDSSRRLDRSIIELDNQLQDLMIAERMNTEIAIAVTRDLRDKKILRRQLGDRTTQVHRLMKRLSDPSVPKFLIEEFESKRRAKMLESIVEKVI